METENLTDRSRATLATASGARSAGVAMRFLFLLALAMALAGCAHRSSSPQESAPQAAACPADSRRETLPARPGFVGRLLPGGARAVEGTRVLHAHGGPTLGAPRDRTAEDIKRWAVAVKAGYAWAGSVFRQGGVAVRAAAEDTERLRRIFVEHVARPRFTILHGQSWGAGRRRAPGVHARVGRRPRAVLLSSGVLAGGSKAYDFRLDLRVVYQALCANHPQAEEGSYPLWRGLPPAASWRRTNCAARGQVSRPAPAGGRAHARAGAQAATLITVIKIPAKAIAGHLAWATWHFQDIVQRTAGQPVRQRPRAVPRLGRRRRAQRGRRCATVPTPRRRPTSRPTPIPTAASPYRCSRCTASRRDSIRRDRHGFRSTMEQPAPPASWCRPSPRTARTATSATRSTRPCSPSCCNGRAAAKSRHPPPSPSAAVASRPHSGPVAVSVPTTGRSRSHRASRRAADPARRDN